MLIPIMDDSYFNMEPSKLGRKSPRLVNKTGLHCGLAVNEVELQLNVNTAKLAPFRRTKSANQFKINDIKTCALLTYFPIKNVYFCVQLKKIHRKMCLIKMLSI